jgi:hypothetical protein
MNVNPFDKPIAPFQTKKDGLTCMGLQREWEQPEVKKELEPKVIPVKTKVPKSLKSLILKHRK